MAISWRWQSETYPRAWFSLLKQCHSPLALRQYSFSVSPSGVSSIGTRVYTNHHETLDSSKSRTSRRFAANVTLPWSPGYSPRYPVARAAHRIDPWQHAPVRFEGQSTVLDNPAMESARSPKCCFAKPAAPLSVSVCEIKYLLRPH
jgi:hypothetical protein